MKHIVVLVIYVMVVQVQQYQQVTVAEEGVINLVTMHFVDKTFLYEKKLLNEQELERSPTPGERKPHLSVAVHEENRRSPRFTIAWDAQMTLHLLIAGVQGEDS